MLIFLCLVVPAWGQEECREVNERLVLNLEAALSRALNYNRQLIGTTENITNSQYQIQIADAAFDLGISPNSEAGYHGGSNDVGFDIGGGVNLSKQFKEGFSVSFAPKFIKSQNHYASNFNVMFKMPLLRGFGKDYQLAGIRGAEFAMRSARRNLYVAQIQLIIKTITALYDVIKAKKAVELSDESHQRISTYYQAAKLKEKIGLSDALDVYRAEIELRQAQDTLTGAQERLQELEDALRDILALPMDTEFDVEVHLTYRQNNIEIDKAVDLALKNRTEIDQGIDVWRESYRLAALAKKDLLPELNLEFNYNSHGKHEFLTRSFRSRNRDGSFNIGFTTSTDFDPLGDQIAYDQSMTAINNAARDLEQTKANLTLEVKKTVRQLERSNKRILLQEEQIHSTQGELHLAKLKFDRGMANNFDVIQAEKNFRNAEQTYWTALIDHIIGEYQLLAAIGLLIDKPCIE